MENYVHLNPASEDEAQKKQWAGDKGFTVTITKPYYWEAGTAKEKEFFIGSMVKIYNKYTKGDFPILTGFSANELGSLTNGQPHLATSEGRAAFANGESARAPTSQQRPGTADQRPLPPKSPGPPPRRPGESPALSSEDGRRGPIAGANPNFRRPPGEYQGPRRPGQPDDQFRPGSRPSTGDDSRRPSPFIPNQGTPPMPDLRQKRSMEQSIRSRPSGDSMRMRPGQGRDPIPPTPPFPSRTLTPQSSTSEFTGRPRTPESSNLPPSLSPGRRPAGDDAQSQRSQRSVEDSPYDGAATGTPPLEQRRQNGLPPPRRDLSPRGLRPGTAQSNASSNFTRVEDAPPEEPPQRRRPLMEPRPSQASQRSVDSQSNEPRSVFHTPSESPGPPIDIPPRRRPQEIPERLRPTPQNPAETLNNAGASLESPQPTPAPTTPLPQLPPTLPSQAPQPLDVAPPVQIASVESEAVQNGIPPVEEKDNEIAHRPGLGPMVKKSLGPADAASKFRKAAAAAGAFKPRAGGAAAKLFNKEAKTSDEADGVNAVFVPQRPIPKETPKEEIDTKLEEVPKSPPKAVPDRLSKERPRISTEIVPSVTVSSPLSPTPAGAIPEVDEQAIIPIPEKSASRKTEAEPEVRRKKRRSNQQIMNISKLGIDPGVIDERGLEFEGLLSELGWGSSELSAKHIENLELDIKREIARVEAGSWLNHLEQKDDRVEAVERMLDRAIAECDELEGLLTLYNVELSVSNATSLL